MSRVCADCGEPKSPKGLYCKPCGYKHRKRPSGLKYIIIKQNPTAFKPGQRPWNFGLRSEFKGQSLDGLHAWVERNLGKPKKCDLCGTDKAKVYQWSNISGEYLHDLSDWQRACVACHQRFDYENFGARKVFFEGGNPIHV